MHCLPLGGQVWGSKAKEPLFSKKEMFKESQARKLLLIPVALRVLSNGDGGMLPSRSENKRVCLAFLSKGSTLPQ